MSNESECRFCGHCDPLRKKNGMLRCKHHHKYTPPNGLCYAYRDGKLYELCQKIGKAFLNAKELVKQVPKNKKKYKPTLGGKKHG